MKFYELSLNSQMIINIIVIMAIILLRMEYELSERAGAGNEFNENLM
jgi:hypothetical protein